MLVENRENFTLNQLLDLKLKWEDELIRIKHRLKVLEIAERTESFTYDELIDLEFDLENELELLNNEINENNGVKKMNYEKLKQSLIENEGLELKVYTCPAGYKTIGVGRNLETRGITEAEANFLLNNDIDLAYDFLEKELNSFPILSLERKNVLIEMVFNLGENGFKKFQKMIKALENLDFEKASNEMLNSKWHRDFISLRKDKDEKETRSYKLALQMKKGEFI